MSYELLFEELRGWGVLCKQSGKAERRSQELLEFSASRAAEPSSDDSFERY